MNSDNIHIGQIRSVNPARRELRIEARDRWIKKIEELGWLLVQPPRGETLHCKVVAVLARSGFAIVTLAPGVNRDTVAGMKGHRVLLPVSENVPPDPLEANMDEYIGLTVIGENGATLGEVVAGFESKANGVLEILFLDGRSLLVPRIPEVVKDVDWDTKTLTVHDITPFAVENDTGSRLV